MSELRDKQSAFVRMDGDLIRFATREGYELTSGEVFRTDEQAEINALGFEGRARVAALIEAEFPDLAEKIRNNGKADGVRNSVHCLKLAHDYNLFLNGVFLEDGSGHDFLHDYWDSIGGAERIAKDMNHYSLGHEGVR